MKKNYFRKHTTWRPSHKLFFGKDTAVYLSPRSRNSYTLAESVYEYLSDTFEKTALVLRFDRIASTVRLYFDSSDESTVELLTNYIKSKRSMMIVEVMSPANESHREKITNIKSTHDIRPNLYYGKYKYSVSTYIKNTFNLSMSEIRMRRQEIVDKLVGEDDRVFIEFNIIRYFTNDLESITYALMAGDVDDCKVKEAILYELNE